MQQPSSQPSSLPTQSAALSPASTPVAGFHTDSAMEGAQSPDASDPASRMRFTRPARSTTPAAGTLAPKAQRQRIGPRAQRPERTEPRSPRRRQSERERRRRAYRRVRATLEQGMALGPCAFITLVAKRQRADGTVGRDYHVEPTIRSEVWHLLWTRIRRRWPDAQAFTVMEWGPRTGIHLHTVVRAAPGLSGDWMREALASQYPMIDVHQKAVDDPWGLASYLPKDLLPDRPSTTAMWGRYAHPTSHSRGWLP